MIFSIYVKDFFYLPWLLLISVENIIILKVSNSINQSNCWDKKEKLF